MRFTSVAFLMVTLFKALCSPCVARDLGVRADWFKAELDYRLALNGDGPLRDCYGIQGGISCETDRAAFALYARAMSAYSPSVRDIFSQVRVDILSKNNVLISVRVKGTSSDVPNTMQFTVVTISTLRTLDSSTGDSDPDKVKAATRLGLMPGQAQAVGYTPASMDTPFGSVSCISHPPQLSLLQHCDFNGGK